MLNEDQRTAKRQLIRENRERKHIEQIRDVLKSSALNDNTLNESDRVLIAAVTNSYCRSIDGHVSETNHLDLQIAIERGETSAWQAIMTPLIKLCIDFAKGIPPFLQVLMHSE